VTDEKQFIVGVFVERRKRGWRFSAYTRDYNPTWHGHNRVEVQAKNGTEAKRKAIAIIKARMDLKSTVAPSDVFVYGD
jgi:hypothetical protein